MSHLWYLTTEPLRENRSQIWPQAKKSVAKIRENRPDLESSFRIEIFAQMALSSLSRYLRVNFGATKKLRRVQKISRRNFSFYFPAFPIYLAKISPNFMLRSRATS